MRIYFFPFLFAVLLISSCKLNLNNPSDPASSDFFLTNLIRAYLLSDPCLNFQTWKKTYGTGTKKTTGSDLLILSNGDYLISGVTQEYLVPGSSAGVAHGFEGDVGITLNTFLMRVSHTNGEILWVDYLGEAVDEVTYKPKLRKYPNGDISVALIVTGYEQAGGPLNAKSGMGIPSLFVGRIRENGTRVWFTYFDSNSIGNFVVSAMDTSNNLHVFIENTGGSGHASFGDGPTIINSTSGGESDSDFIHLAVGENGPMLFQRYFSSGGDDFIFGAEANASGLFITGGTNQSVSGTIHPYADSQMPFVMKLNEADGTILWYSYLGTTDEGGYGDPNRFLVKDDSIYTITSGRYTYGSPAEPLVASNGTIKHYIFSKFNVSGALLWNSFLGSATESILEMTESEPLWLSSSQLLMRTQASSSTGQYSSAPDSTTGNGSGSYQLADIFINPQSGTFNRFHYSSNLTSPAQERTEVMREVCSGKLARLNYTKFTTAPNPIPTQISIENVSLP
ncbi:hypothetical protein [Leptospira brenneri]|uniref:Lipoprotein n=1 Tax=Leptospira brenneri TaxID=2023182 RepID=A0A2M9Y6W9_9LEPT|nr:hypothetical protein [Leptospira brenneri]PJZ47314.1 hypothetical protein CH361_03010 [Leptospira brenneri]TGK95719.1 hypothetical protein EHQ30_03530 [Leptospira brenneri]